MNRPEVTNPEAASSDLPAVAAAPYVEKINRIPLIRGCIDHSGYCDLNNADDFDVLRCYCEDVLRSE